jgi:hypothetical protein
MKMPGSTADFCVYRAKGSPATPLDPPLSGRALFNQVVPSRSIVGTYLDCLQDLCRDFGHWDWGVGTNRAPGCYFDSSAASRRLCGISLDLPS